LRQVDTLRDVVTSARLRPVVHAALARHAIAPVRIRLLLHGYNTTFRIDTADGDRYALRINVRGRQDPANLDAEAAWLEALHDSPITVPRPIRTIDDRAWSVVWSEALGRPVPVVLMSWLPGRDLDAALPDGDAALPDGDAALPDGRTPDARALEAIGALGSTMAALHSHAEGWRPPAGARFPALDEIDVAGFERLDARSASVLFEAASVVQTAIDEARRAVPIIALHADLHAGNVKWFRGRIAVFDFDDASLGVPVQDLAIAAYYLRDEPAFEEALFAGYTDVRDRPLVHPDHFEALVAGRNLQILHDVLDGAGPGGSGAAARHFAAVYARNTVTKMRAFLSSGSYRHDVPGLEKISL
jgi:Ser/Thr protein kinase RdoA (MazF antagonist)